MLRPVGIFGRNIQRAYGPATDTLATPTAVTGLWWQNPMAQLQQIVIDDIYGGAPLPIDRIAAMRVPGIARGRNLLVGSISDLPFVVLNGDTPVKEQPQWVTKTAAATIWHRWAWTVDDLIFYGAALWWRVNDDEGRLADAWRVPKHRWKINEVDTLEVLSDDNVWFVPDESQVIYIPGPGDPLLGNASDTIEGARNIDRAWVSRTRTAIPPTLFEQTEKEVADPEAVKTLLSSWAKARTNPESAATGFVPYGLKANFAPVNDDAQMFIQGRNAVRLDIANFLNMPASLLDGSTATASLTYQTAEGERSSFHEQTMRYWTAPLEHRLSQDDIVGEGERARFDITYTTQVAPNGEPGED